MKCFGSYAFLVFVTVIYPHVCAEIQSVLLKKSVTLPGCACSGSAAWTFGWTVLFVNKAPRNANPRMSIVGDYALKITSVTLADEGDYSCVCDGEPANGYTLVVEVSPRLSISLDGREISDIITVEANRSTLLVCKAVDSKPVASLRWEADGDQTEAYNSTEERWANGTFVSVSYLDIKLSAERTNVSCISSGGGTFEGKRQDVILSTYVVPSVSLTLGKNETEGAVLIPLGETLNATCRAVGARPPSNITWSVDGMHLEYTSQGMTTVKHADTYSTTSVLSVTAEQPQGHVTCHVLLAYPDERIDLVAKYMTYVVPKVSITIDGGTAESPFIVEKGATLSVICRGIGALPRVDLHWLIDGRRTEEDSKSGLANDDEPMTFDSSVSITIGPIRAPGNMTCIAQGLPTGDLYTHAYFYLEESSDFQGALTSTWLLIGLGVSTICLALVICLYIIKKRFTAGQYPPNGEVRFPMGHVSTMERQHTDSKLPSTSSYEIPSSQCGRSSSIRSSVRVERTASFFDTVNEYPKPPTAALPELPAASEETEYTVVPDEDHAYYSAVRETATQARIYHAKNMRMLLKVKQGHLYNRWMGTIGASDAATKRVLITTVSDSALQRKELHWDDYVQRILEVPKHRNIPFVEGICIDVAHLYLVQEYFICDTVDAKISASNPEGTIEKITDHVSIIEAQRYIIEILEGLEVVHSFGFLHPGLSSSKILISSDGVCKIYDFCLAEDAAKTVATKKTMRPLSVNDLALEALQRNEYTWASDVWSAAVVTWEILAGGKPPFLTDSHEGGEDINGMTVSTDAWSSQFECLRNDLLYMCWEIDCSDRPTITEMKVSYMKLFESIKEALRPGSHLSAMMDLYVPMKGSIVDEALAGQ